MHNAFTAVRAAIGGAQVDQLGNKISTVLFFLRSTIEDCRLMVPASSKIANTLRVLVAFLSSILLLMMVESVNASLTIKNGETMLFTTNQVMVINGDLIIEVEGQLTGANGSATQVSGNWHNSGTYFHGNGSVYFTGSAVSQITGTNTFHTLVSDFARADTSAGKTLQFDSTNTQTIVSHLQIKGDATNDLAVQATVSDTAALINLNGATFDISDVNVKDNHATNVTGRAINPTASIDSGNTINWFIFSELAEILEDSASTGGASNANGTPVSLAQLQSEANNVNPALLTQYQGAVAAEMGFSNLPTAAEVQAVIDGVNARAGAAQSEILEDSASTGGAYNANGMLVSLVQLQMVATNVNASLLSLYQAAVTNEHGFSNPPTISEVQGLVNNVNGGAQTTALTEILEDSASVGGANNANANFVSLAQLQVVANNVKSALLADYQIAIRNHANFSNLPTAVQVQGVIDQVNATASAAVLSEILEDSDSPGGANNANDTPVSLAQLQIVANNVAPGLLAQYQTAINNELGFANPPTAAQVQATIGRINAQTQASVLAEVLEDSASVGGANNANGNLVTWAQLNSISGINNLKGGLLGVYQQAVKNEQGFSNPVTVAEVQALINKANKNYVMALREVLEDSASNGGANNANGSKVTSSQLENLGFGNLDSSLLSMYQAAIAVEQNFDNPPTLAQIQTIVNAVNQQDGNVSVRYPTFNSGVVADGEIVNHLLGSQSVLANIIAEMDPSDRSKGYSQYRNLDLNDTATITAGHRAELGAEDGLLQVDSDNRTREAYIDIDGDNTPDYMWNPNAHTIEKVNLTLQEYVAEGSNSVVQLTNNRGYPLGHTNAAPVASSRPQLNVAGPSGHLFRLWGHAAGEFVPVTGWLTIPVTGRMMVTKSDYINTLDYGNNLVVMKGSVSLPVALNVSGDIKIDKKANRKDVSVGNKVLYTIDIENVSNVTQSHVGIIDKLPPGFRYVEGTALYNGAAITPHKIGGTGLHFVLGSVPTGTTTHTLKYQLVVGTGVNFGKYDNTATAVDTKGTNDTHDDMSLSAQAKASVNVVPDALFDLSTIIGKVYRDINGDGMQNEGEQPIAHAELLTSAGQLIRTDSNGQYHLANVAPGRMVVRLDQRSLPAGTIIVGHKSKVVDVKPGVPVKVNFAVQLPLGDSALSNNKLDVRQLQGKPTPVLNIASMNAGQWHERQGRFLQPMEIRMHSNYAAFIQHWTVSIRERLSGDMVKTFKGSRATLFNPLWWDGTLDDGAGRLDLDKQYTLQLMVENQHGQQATTHAQAIEISLADFMSSEQDTQLAESHRVQRLAKLRNSDSTQNSAIRVTGRAVEVQVNDDHAAYIRYSQEGEPLLTMPVINAIDATAIDLLINGFDTYGSIPNVILPYGNITIDAQHDEGTQPAVIATKQLAIGSSASLASVDGQDYVLVGIIDAEVGYRQITGNLETATSGDSRYAERLWKDGKVQLYFKGMISGDMLLTVNIDTDRDTEEMYRLLGNGASYAIYGDQSSVGDLAGEANGPLYVLIEKDESWAKWGRVNPDFNRTQLTRFQRSVVGAQMHYESVHSDVHGQPKTELDLFDARVYQKAAYVEYSSPTGSLFYLKHKDVVADSLRLRLDIRDSINGNVISTVEYQQGRDFEFNAAAGRIILNRPLFGSNSGTTLIVGNQSGHNGDPIYLVADYSYMVLDDWNKGVTGGTVRSSLTDHISIGAVVVNEDQKEAIYQLKGVDATIHLDDQNKHALDVEYAQSQSRAAPKHVSTDGGFTWGISENQISTADSDTKGQAVAVQGKSSFRDDKVQVDYYYRNVDEDFSAEATQYQQGREAVGASVKIKVDEDLNVTVKHDSQKRKAAGDSQENNRVGAKSSHVTSIRADQQVNDDLQVSVELRHQDVNEPDTNNQAEANADMDAIAVQVRYQAAVNTELTLKQQVTLKGEDNTHTTVDIHHGVSERLSVNAGGSHGKQVATAHAGVDYAASEKVSLNSGVKYDTDDRLTSNVGISYTQESGHAYRVSATDDRGGDKDSAQSVAVGASMSLTDSTTISVDTSVKYSGNGQQNGTSATLAHELDDQRNLSVSVANYDQTSADEQSTGNDITVALDLDENWAIDVKTGQGYVHRLDGGMDKRTSVGLGASYIQGEEDGNEQLRGMVRYGYVKDSGQNNRHQHVLKTNLQGKYNDNTTLYTGLDWAQTKDKQTGAVEAKDNQFDFGFAYRPVTNDKLNLLAKYSWIEERKLAGQTSNSDVEAIKGHVLATDVLYDFNYQWRLGSRLVVRKAQETITDMPETESTTWLSALNARRYLDDDTWASAEYRVLDSSLAKDQKEGLVIELGRRFDKNMEFAAGYNWAGFNTDLVDLDYNIKGFYLRFSYVFE